MSLTKAAYQVLIKERAALCLAGLHDWKFGGLPPMWRKCKRCGVTR